MYTCLSTVSCDVLIYFDSFPFFNMLHHLLLPRGDTVIAHCECQYLTLNELKVYQTMEGNPPGFPYISHLGKRKIIFKNALRKGGCPTDFCIPQMRLGPSPLMILLNSPTDRLQRMRTWVTKHIYRKEGENIYLGCWCWTCLDLELKHILRKKQMCRHGFIYIEAKNNIWYIYIYIYLQLASSSAAIYLPTRLWIFFWNMEIYCIWAKPSWCKTYSQGAE